MTKTKSLLLLLWTLSAHSTLAKVRQFRRDTVLVPDDSAQDDNNNKAWELLLQPRVRRKMIVKKSREQYNDHQMLEAILMEDHLSMSMPSAPSAPVPSAPTVAPTKDSVPTVAPTKDSVPTVAPTKEPVPTATPVAQEITTDPTQPDTEAPTDAPVMATLPPSIANEPTSPPVVSEITTPPTDNCNEQVRADALFDVLSLISSPEDLSDETTPQGFAYNWLITDPAVTDYCVLEPTPVIVQRYVTVVFFASTGGDNWIRRDGWLSALDECEWFGITCNSDGRLSGLSLGKCIDTSPSVIERPITCILPGQS